MSDVQNEICITNEVVRGMTLQAGEVYTAFLEGCGKNLLWAVMGATNSNLWTSTPPNSHIHRPHSCPSFTSCPEIQSAVGRYSGALLCGVQRGERVCTWSTCTVEQQKFPALLGLCIFMQKAGEKTKSSPPLNTMKSLR